MSGVAGYMMTLGHIKLEMAVIINISGLHTYETKLYIEFLEPAQLMAL